MNDTLGDVADELYKRLAMARRLGASPKTVRKLRTAYLAADDVRAEIRGNYWRNRRR